MDATKLKYGKDGFSVNKKSDTLKDMSEDDLRELKAKGKIVYRPAKTKDGKQERCLDGTTYNIVGGTRRRAIPKTKLSKKERRRLRQALKDSGMGEQANEI